MHMQIIPHHAANGILIMSSLEIAALVEKRHDNVKRTIETLAERGVIQLPQTEEVTNFQSLSPNSKTTAYVFSGEQGKRDSIIAVAQLSPEFTARLVDRWQELEKQIGRISTPRTFAEALRLAAELEEQKEALAHERDEAVRTKAEIGTRREATAMNTASQAVKRVNRLEAQLDQSRQYASIKRMEMLYHGQKFNWRTLKSTANEMSIESIDIFDANYGTVKAYHADVWRETYALEIDGGEA